MTALADMALGVMERAPRRTVALIHHTADADAADTWARGLERDYHVVRFNETTIGAMLGASIDFSLAWGEWTMRGPGMSDDEPRVRLGANGGDAFFLENCGGEEVWMQRVGAARSGCALDGVEYPEVVRG